jgi:hypothetical protein
LPFVATKLTQSPWFLKTPDDCQPPFMHSSKVLGSGSTDTLSMRTPPQPKLVRLVKEIVVVALLRR